MNEQVSEFSVKQGLYKLLGEVFKVLANPVRIKILRLLLHHSPPLEATFSEIMFSLRVNPNVLNYHLAKLMKYDMIAKTEEGKYRITEIGQMALSVDPADIIGLVEEALERAKTKGLITPEPSP